MTMKKTFFLIALLLPSFSYSAEGNATAELSARVTSLEEYNRQLTGRIEELEYQLKQAESRLNQVENTQRNLAEASKFQPDAAETANPYVTRVGDINPKYQKAPSQQPEPETNPAMEEEFDTAFTYIATEDYALAKPALNKFISKYPRTNLAGESYFWLGEIAWAEKDYNNAAINYLKGYKEHPAGDKAAENILKLALTLRELKKNDQACKNLQRFDTEFQDAHVSLQSKAKSARAELGCS